MLIQSLYYKNLKEPLLESMIKIGIATTKQEIYQTVIQDNEFSDGLLDRMHEYKSGAHVPEINYRLDWCLTILKQDGLVENYSRGVWGIKSEYKDKSLNELMQLISNNTDQVDSSDEVIESSTEEESDYIDQEKWDKSQEFIIKKELINKLLKMNPYDFEQFCSMVFSEAGCTEVKTTSKSKDHGIDGYGYYKINSVMNSQFAFQCKRYAKDEVVSEEQIKAFITSCNNYGRGVFITTSRFSKNAMEIAKSNHSVDIDLIDGERLCDIIFKLKIGYKQAYVIDELFFNKYNYDE